MSGKQLDYAFAIYQLADFISVGCWQTFLTYWTEELGQNADEAESLFAEIRRRADMSEDDDESGIVWT